jgi:sigma-B regulation protein RsbU (phosphoserine phosphatase)
LKFANAGHNPPIVVRASGAHEMLDGGGPVLGIIPFAPYSQMQIELHPGDMLTMYSDGVTEAVDVNENEYGEDRLIEVLKKNRAEPATAIVQAVTKSLAEFALGAPQADDITLLVAKVV